MSGRFVRMLRPQFAELVERGIKLQTVRPVPKRMPKSGDALSLRTWSGKAYRSTQRVLLDAVVTDVYPVRIFQCGIIQNGQRLSDWHVRRFAEADGFDGVQEMLNWFESAHGLPFDGIVICWKPKEEKK
jgi:hypothetical protein